MADKDTQQSDCACASFDRLEGASVTAYIASFLENEKGSNEPNRYRCRVCGRSWEKAAADHEGGRASLVRLESD